MPSTFIVAAVIGFTEFVKSLFDRNYRAAVIIAGAALIGGVTGYFHIEGVTIANGIVFGLTAAGVITTAKYVRSS